MPQSCMNLLWHKQHLMTFLHSKNDHCLQHWPVYA